MVGALPLVGEQIVEADPIAVDAGQFGDAGYLPRTVGEQVVLDNEAVLARFNALSDSDVPQAPPVEIGVLEVVAQIVVAARPVVADAVTGQEEDQ